MKARVFTCPEERNRTGLHVWLAKRHAGITLPDLRTEAQIIAWRVLMFRLAHAYLEVPDEKCSRPNQCDRLQRAPRAAHGRL